MKFLHALVRYIDVFTDRSGRLLAWLSLCMALLTALIVILRYGFNVGSITSQEAVIYMHGCLFMLGAAYTLKTDGHVRVDILYRNFSLRTRAWINSLGGIIFLIPLCLFILGVSWNYVLESWAIREVSPEPGGIPAVFLLKSLLPVMAINLLLQGIAETARNAITLVEGGH
ncbi:MAG: TRAP transporter small permease subunit [Halioglobus sp.]